jgi:hypothetical protein
MLSEHDPSEQILEWSVNYVANSFDRPWFYAEPPLMVIEYYQPPCRCSRAVKLHKHPCEDEAGCIYLGQCEWCETIIWSYKEF